ncbi:hypothetical protein EG328_000555 [Venturia inaequalis]|uniref:Uncharacterized protein n=1 Tax=Venturia inaequalis TaxID=5025 RepID=A0A8H3VG06_VENIN|nr:hypothetical protein EG328_000555 [Venturia inaequalis]RDI77633.1 hypothetical protein Vi05172_g12333 [Venturia inaequalis]
MSSTYLNLTTITISTVILSTIFALTTIGPATILKRLQKTKYNYEVTLALYMLTPTERFIFSTPTSCSLHSPTPYPFPIPNPPMSLPLLRKLQNRPPLDLIHDYTKPVTAANFKLIDSILFLALSLLLIAAFLYLPEHIATIGRRAFYYCFGDDQIQSSSYSAHVAGDVARRTMNAAKGVS